MPRKRALGAATVAIMKAIQDGRRFGLDIMDETGLASGTVYPTLARMEARAYLESEWEGEDAAKAAGRPPRRYYRITPEGTTALLEAVEHLAAMAGLHPRPAEQG